MSAPRPCSVLVLAPTGDDGPLTERVLAQAGFNACVLRDLSELARQIARGCGAVLIATEALAAPERGELEDALRRQEPWSDVPVLLLAHASEEDPAALGERLGMLGNFTVLERPLRVLTLISAVRSALRARERQYEMRDQLAERAHIQLQMLESQKLESLGVLAGGLAHDFNNLLTTVIGNACLAQELAADHPELSESLSDIVFAAEQGAQLTAQMLAYAGKGNLNMRVLDLRDAIDPIVRLLSRSINPSVSLRARLPPGVPCVSVDSAQLQQVVMNLVLNAAEAIGEDQVGTIDVAIEPRNVTASDLTRMIVPPPAPGPHVALIVSDTGPGIPEGVRRRIFEPFFSTKFTGRGLGLSAVQGILRRHRAGLVLDTAPGQGTRFEVVFPVAHDSPKAAPVQPAASPLARRALILVVDDEPPVRKLAQSVLRAHGYDILLADNGQAAVEALRSRPDDVQLVLLDATMPVMTGQQAIPLLRAIRPDIRILVMSGYGAAQLAERFPDLGAAGHLPKPFTPVMLLSAAARAIGHPEPSR